MENGPSGKVVAVAWRRRRRWPDLRSSPSRTWEFDDSNDPFQHSVIAPTADATARRHPRDTSNPRHTAAMSLERPFPSPNGRSRSNVRCRIRPAGRPVVRDVRDEVAEHVAGRAVDERRGGGSGAGGGGRGAGGGPTRKVANRGRSARPSVLAGPPSTAGNPRGRWGACVPGRCHCRSRCRRRARVGRTRPSSRTAVRRRWSVGWGTSGRGRRSRVRVRPGCGQSGEGTAPVVLPTSGRSATGCRRRRPGPGPAPGSRSCRSGCRRTPRGAARHRCQVPAGSQR